MDETIRFSAEGVPQWFSPEHAGEKFKRIGLDLACLAGEAQAKKLKGFAKKIQGIQAIADEYACHYSARCPIRSVRIMQPSGAIFVILADGREVLVPQPDPEDCPKPRARRSSKKAVKK